VRTTTLPSLTTALLLACSPTSPSTPGHEADVEAGNDEASGGDEGGGDEGAADREGAEGETGSQDATVDVEGDQVDIEVVPPAGTFCSLPGSVVWTPQGPVVVAGAGAPTPDVTWLHVPVGFCAHYFGTVKTARQLKFAPGGELFVASPRTGTTGGAGDGIAGIVVLPDDNRDGIADSNLTFLAQLPSVQGLMFANGYFYYQDDTIIRRVPYRTGNRQPLGASEVVTTMSPWPQATEHWPRVLDQAQDGTIYISNGGSQVDACDSARTVRGAIVRLNADGSTSEVAKGFRNPIALRCEPGHNVCLAVELALDYSASTAGREKLVPVRQGDDWGYPCCATQNTPYGGVTYVDTGAVPDCSGVAQESDAFVIGNTPFGVDFETGRWPAPWNGRAFVTLHGVVGSWTGSRVVAIALDASGMPLPASEIDVEAGDPSSMLEFATGWDDGKQDHGRPAPVAFAPDGRMFLGDDQKGAVIWIAPVGLVQ
jgi:glucose/arabinose dehydrogenase